MKLTLRENQIMYLVSEGYTNLHIAMRLGICEGTVKNHLYSVYYKLEATNRITAIIAFNEGKEYENEFEGAIQTRAYQQRDISNRKETTTSGKR